MKTAIQKKMLRLIAIDTVVIRSKRMFPESEYQQLQKERQALLQDLLEADEPLANRLALAATRSQSWHYDHDALITEIEQWVGGQAEDASA